MTTEYERNDPEGPMALFPLFLPNATSSIEDYDYGVPVRAVEGGLRFSIDPWLSMSVDDYLEIFWGNSLSAVWSKSIDKDDLNRRVTGSINESFIVRGDTHPVFYRVTRPGGGEGEDSRPLLSVLVKLDRPGGFDSDIGEPGHQGLRYFIPQAIIDDGVGPDEAALGIPITILPYEFMRKNDLIRLTWGSEELVTKVEQRHIDDPLNNPLVVMVDAKTLEDAGDGARIAVTYQVIDECGNYPDKRSPWAVTTYILVDLKQNRLDPAIVISADPGTDIIDLEALGEEDVEVIVNTAGSAFKVNDKIALKWFGIPAEGTPVIYEPAELPVVRVGVAVPFSVPNAIVRAIAMGRASVSYLLKREGTLDRPSKNASVSVSGVIERLPAPAVVEAPEGYLDPDLRWATVECPWYPGRRSSDLLKLIWEATRPGGGTVHYEEAMPVGDVPDGEPVLRNVISTEIQRFDGLQVSVFYTVANDDESIFNVRESYPFVMQVGEALPLFSSPRVQEAVPGTSLIDPDAVPPLGCKLIATHLETQVDDEVHYRWRGSVGNGSTSGSLRLTSQTAGKEVPFTVPKQFVTNNLNRRIVIDYFIVRNNKTLGYSLPLTLRVGNALLDFDPPTIDGSRGDQIDVSAVPGVGATLRLAAAYGLRVGDSGEIRWIGTPGGGTAIVPFSVESGEAGRDKLVTVPRSVVLANVGREISLDCTVVRQTGGRQYSRVAVYDVRVSLGTGRLLVMGARSRGNYQLYGGGTAWLTALDATTRQPVRAWWRYNGEEGEVSGTTFRDTRPDRLLHVRISDDQVTINPQNLCGNGNFISGQAANNAAFAARTERGTLVAWGKPDRGGNLGNSLPDISDAISLSACGYAFAARQATGAVVAWGLSGNGGVVSEPISLLRDIEAVSGNGYVFVALRRDRSLVAWGSSTAGAALPEPVATLRDVVRVIGNLYAFAALRANGSVVAWGDQSYGGNLPESIAVLTDIVDIVASAYVFAALRANGSVVAWGPYSYGGLVPNRIEMLTDIVELSGTEAAFAARRSNGSVVAWGYSASGASVPEPIALLTDIRTVTGNSGSFVALLSSGRVVGWGRQAVPTPVALLTDVVQVVCAEYAFAALRANGTVVAWGYADRGGEIPEAIATRLINVRAIYGNTHAFAALTSSGEVVTWGRGPAGGDSDAVADQLNGKIFYEATALSRGLGMRETRLLEAAETEQTS
ncbi:RCC1 domain-containing protein [Pseudomonas koreensis]